MKLCPLCQHCYEDTFTSCAHDQATLIEGRPGGRLVAQKYTLDRLLLSDGAQSVYAGRHLETDRPYAIKMLALEEGAGAGALKNFRREALANAHLNTRFDHQHAVKTYDYGLLPDGTVYVITELIAGQSLRQYLDEAGPLPAATAVRIAQQVADGLQAAHRCGVVHHDLEPANIMLTRDYYQQLEAKIVDFGFSKLLKQGVEAQNLGAHGPAAQDVPASPYAAPERRAGQNADARSDIYSLGVILYEMLAGRPPVSAGATTAAVGQEDVTGQPPLAQLCDEMPDLARLLTQQLHGKPAARPLSAADVAARLRAVGNILATGYMIAPVEGGQVTAPDETPVQLPDSAADTLSAADEGIQQTALPTADSHPHTREVEPDDLNVAVYDDLDSLQEELERNLDETVVSAKEPAQLPGPAGPLSAGSAILSAPPSGAGTRAGTTQPKAADVLRRARPLYATLIAASLILGLAAGLWVASRHAPVSPPTRSQAASAAEATGPTEQQPEAFAKTSSAVGADSTIEGEVSSTPELGEKQSTSPTPNAVNEPTTRRPPIVDEAQVSKEPVATPSAASDEQRREKGAIGSYVSAEAGSEQRQSGGRPCTLSVSNSSLSLRAGGGSDTITVSSQNVSGPARVTASTKNWPDIAVFPESRGNEGGALKYSIVSVSKRAGTFAVNFKSPCGTRTVPVTVR